MKRTLSILALLTLAACGGGGGGSGGSFIPPTAGSTATSGNPVSTTQAQAPKPAPCTVAYWGDSIAGLTTPHLGAGLIVGGHAVIGGTAQAALPAFLQDPMNERFIGIQYGMNDANGHTDMLIPLRSMLDRIKATGRTAVLTGISGTTAGDATYRATDNALIASLAKEYGALYADWPSVAFAGASDLKPDGVHPLDDYAQRLADRLTQTIVNAAPECRS